MHISGLGALVAKLMLAMLAFPPIYIVAKYLRWCSKTDKEIEQQDEEE